MWFWAALALVAVKIWLTTGQTIYAIGPAFHDDRLFVDLATRLIHGEWLGPYNQFTLAKGPFFPVFIAVVFWLRLPLIFAQQLIYASACGLVTRSLRPWLAPGAPRFALFAALLWNPMSFEASNLGRVMRQNLYTPLALCCVAGLIMLFARRRETAYRQTGPATGAGLAFGAFWLTREESVWFVPAVALLFFGLGFSLRHELIARARSLLTGVGCFALAALLPIAIVCTLNLQHYGWFGTVEFRAPEFNAAYGALTRPIAGPDLEQVPVTRQMREVAYRISPAFAKLRPQLEGPVGDHWADGIHFSVLDRQIRGGWFVWALRDAVAKAGLAPDAGAAMRYYQTVADEINVACDAGRVPAHGRRSGFLPTLELSLARPLYERALEYTGFFLQFRNFTAYTPDSIGDYAELKPFRDILGTRLSNAPRSPEDPEPEQDRRKAWQVETLDRIGHVFANIIGLFGPLILLVGLGRGIESMADRRITFLFGLALALLAACGAYLAINILVDVTSFENMKPAAMASAYPLYLLALAVIVVDASTAWRRPFAAPVVPASLSVGSGSFRNPWLVATGVALIVWAARLAEIHFFASDIPYNDQWVVEAQHVLEPWVKGTLSLGDFFRPHFEHLPVWTRLLAWTEVALTGRWDPLVQMTVNAALHSLFAWLVASWIWRNLRPLPAAMVTGLLLLTACLPHAWENIAWGFQSQFPLALVLISLHVHGSSCRPPGSRGWWWAQAAGAAALFTLASAWLASLALVLSCLWTNSREWRTWLVPAAIAGLGSGILLAVRTTGEFSFLELARSPVDFLFSTLHLLSWPSLLPGAVAIIQLPWLLLALRLRGRTGATPADRMILVLGLLNCLQAAALAFGRTGDSNDFVSRYGDLWVLGVLAGAGALCRLLPCGGRDRPAFAVLAGLWGALVVAGLVHNSTEGHAHYFHLYAEENATLRRTAVQNYLRTGDRTLLEAPGTRAALYWDTTLITRLLDQPGIRALLPASVNPSNAPDIAGRFVRRLQSSWLGLLFAGTLLLAGGAVWHRWRDRGRDPLPTLAVTVDPWRGRIALIVGTAAFVPMLLWSNPLVFDPLGRWQRWLGGDAAITGLTFHFAGPSGFGPERLQGAAPLAPDILRNQFFGTAPEGPGFTGTVVSSPFKITKPWLVIPYAGYPVANGNGLRVRIVDAMGHTIGDELGCNGPNLPTVGYWPLDVSPYVGRQASLVLYDGRTDTEAWVAVAPPIPCESPELATTLSHGLQNEFHASDHATLGVIALVAFACAGLGWVSTRRF